jgi:hypothetical protein
MTREQALQKLSRLVDPAGDFGVPEHVLEDALDDNTRFAVHAVSTAYAVGDRIVPNPFTGRLYRCAVGGTSGATAPTWPTTPGVSTWKLDDGDTLEWEDIGPVKNRPYNFEGAAYDVCMALARMNVGKTDVSDSGVSVKRSQIYDHWISMASSFSLSSEVC